MSHTPDKSYGSLRVPRAAQWGSMTSDKPGGSPPDLELVAELSFGPSGPRPPSVVLYERDLTEADIEALRARPPSPPASLMRIHSSHHSLARCIASGMKPAQAALVTGYSPARISALCRDETFSALVADYRNEVKAVFADLAERMADMSLDAIELLHERLHNAPEQFSIPMLLDVVKSMADRTGHGPGQEVHIKMDRDFIDRPPRETFEDWERRRRAELEGPKPPTDTLQ